MPHDYHGCLDNGPHNFEARYDIRFPPHLANIRTGDKEVVEAFKEKIYIHDICTKCGAVVKREEETCMTES